MPDARLTLLQPAQLLGVTVRSGPNAALTLGPVPSASSALLLSLAPALRGEKGDTGLTGNPGLQGNAGLKGDKGDKGDTGPMAVAIQPTAPDFGPGQPGLWIQTGLGTTGEDFTFWIEDGLL